MDYVPIEIEKNILLYVIYGANSGRKFFQTQNVCWHWFNLLINVVNENNIYLNFDNTNILPESLNRLSSINNLDFINCSKIINRRNSLSDLKKIKAIDLSDNEYLTDRQLESLSSLEKLYLANSIGIDGKFIEKLKNLKLISIGKNIFLKRKYVHILQTRGIKVIWVCWN